MTLKAHINKKYFEPIWFKLLSLWVILWTLEEDCFGCCDDGLCRRDTATIKTLGQFGGAAQKAWEDLFIPHFTNVNWVCTTLCGIQKKPWTDKGKLHWKYVHHCTGWVVPQCRMIGNIYTNQLFFQQTRPPAASNLVANPILGRLPLPGKLISAKNAHYAPFLHFLVS